MQVTSPACKALEALILPEPHINAPYNEIPCMKYHSNKNYSSQLFPQLATSCNHRAALFVLFQGKPRLCN
eukprot:6303113-Amphidinium_carterae.1